MRELIMMEIITPKPLISGKRYYFEKMKRNVHIVYNNKEYSYLVGKEKDILKFQKDKLILRPLVGRNGRHVGVIMSISNLYSPPRIIPWTVLGVKVGGTTTIINQTITIKPSTP